MPTVNLYGNRRVSTGAIPGVRKSAAETPLSMGAGLAEARADTWNAVGRAAQTGLGVGIGILEDRTRVALKARARANDIAAMGFENAIDDGITTILYDQKDGVLTKKGQQAFSSPEDSAAAFTKLASDVGMTAKTPEQREAFNKIVGDKRVSLRMTVLRHVDQQMNAHEAGELTANVTNKTNHAIINALEPKIVGADMASATAAIQRSGPRLGLGPAEIQQQVEATQSKIVGGVIENLLAQEQTAGAHAYFEEAGHLLNAEEHTRIEKALHEGSTRAASQKQADAIMAASEPGEWLKAAKDIDDPEVRDAVESRLEHAITLKERGDREADQARSRSAYDIIDKTGDWRKVPIGQWQQLEGGTRASLKAYAEHKAAGVPVKTDDATWYALMEQARTEPEQFLKQNLLNYRGKLDEGDFKGLEHLRLSLSSGNKGAAAQELAGFQTHNALVSNTLFQFTQTEEKDYSTEQMNAKASLLRLVDSWTAQEQAGGRKVTNEQVQEHIDGLLGQETTVPGSGFWGGFYRALGVDSSTKKRLLDTTYADITADERKQLEAALKANRRAVTPATVLNLYLDTHAKE